MDWKQKLQGAVNETAQAKIQEHWPAIERLFREKVGPAALATAKDEAKMTSASKMVYEALPFPVRLAVKEDAFVQFCLANRDKLLASLEQNKAGA